MCRSLSCEICGSRQITEQIQKTLNLEVGETTPDGRFTLIELECLGSCGTAPAILVNDVLHENMTVETVDELIARLPADASDYHDPTVNWDDGHGHERTVAHRPSTPTAGPTTDGHAAATGLGVSRNLPADEKSGGRRLTPRPTDALPTPHRAVMTDDLSIPGVRRAVGFGRLLIVLLVGLCRRRYVWHCHLATYHLATVQPQVLYRDGNQSPCQFETAVRKVRPRVVVSLIDDAELADQNKPQFQAEADYLAGKGVRLERIPVQLGGWPTKADVDKFISVASDAGQPARPGPLRPGRPPHRHDGGGLSDEATRV